MMLNLSRENAINLINDVRKNVSQEIDLAKYFGEEFSKNIMEQNELTMDVQGISNGFLAEILCMILGYDIEIYGEVEALFPCPCCGLRTLTEEYNVQEGTGYDICPYCNWEDDGTSDINEYRSINRGSIKDYRNKIKENFNKYYINKWLEK